MIPARRFSMDQLQRAEALWSDSKEDLAPFMEAIFREARERRLTEEKQEMTRQAETHVVRSFVLPERIRKCRKSLGHSQKQFAELLGVHKNSVQAWEADRRFPDAMSLILICQNCRVSADWLLGLTNMEPNDD